MGGRDFSMIWVAFTLAYLCFLHCSEFKCQGVSKFRPQFDLLADHVLFHPSLASLRQTSIILKLFKPNVFREGYQHAIACSPSPLCAVSAMCSYYFSLPHARWGPYSHSSLADTLLGRRLYTFLGMPPFTPVFLKNPSRVIVFE